MNIHKSGNTSPKSVVLPTSSSGGRGGDNSLTPPPPPLRPNLSRITTRFPLQSSLKHSSHNNNKNGVVRPPPPPSHSSNSSYGLKVIQPPSQRLPDRELRQMFEDAKEESQKKHSQMAKLRASARKKTALAMTMMQESVRLMEEAEDEMYDADCLQEELYSKEFSMSFNVDSPTIEEEEEDESGYDDSEVSSEC